MPILLSPKNWCVCLFFQDFNTATRVWQAVLSIFFLKSKRHRATLPDSLSEYPDPSTSLHCFILFTGYLLNGGSNTRCLCFALRPFLIKLPSTFQNLFTFTLIPGSSALLQTSECSECHTSSPGSKIFLDSLSDVP